MLGMSAVFLVRPGLTDVHIGPPGTGPLPFWKVASFSVVFFYGVQVPLPVNRYPSDRSSDKKDQLESNTIDNRYRVPMHYRTLRIVSLRLGCEAKYFT
jgi:hypothetical protein